VNATADRIEEAASANNVRFQWAPTLGGECYEPVFALAVQNGFKEFQWAPTLGGECYNDATDDLRASHLCRFNGHPPLGVNAT